MLDAFRLRMLDHTAGNVAAELPADFTRFLSGRLGLEPATTLSVLGTFLVNFEPSGRCPSLVLSAHPVQPPPSNT